MYIVERMTNYDIKNDYKNKIYKGNEYLEYNHEDPMFSPLSF